MKYRLLLLLFTLSFSPACSKLADIMWKQADASAFQVVILSPENNTSTNRAQVTFSGTAAVSNPFKVYQVEISINGGSFVPADGAEVWTATLTLPEGTNSVIARAINTMGETNLSAPCRVIIDTVSPTMLIDNPTNNMNAAPSYSFACAPSDTMSGIAKVFVKLDGGVFDQISPVSAVWTTNLSLTYYGTHTNYAYAVDHAGNTSLTQSVVFSCTRPTITVADPAGDLFTFGIASYTIKGTCSAIGGISGIFLSTNNSPYFYISSSAEWSKAVSLVMGVCSTNQYKIYAMDTSGRISLTNSFKSVGYNKFAASDGAVNDFFGKSVAVSADGNTMIAGADYDDVGANADQGSAYVYRWNGTNWIQTKLAASDGAVSDYFGKSVAVSADGNTLAIGANYDDVGANADQGSVYIYKWNGSSWAQQTKLTASDGAAGDWFGQSVTISADGNTVVIGVWGDNVGANANQGSAYVYRWNGTSWTQTNLKASDGAADDRFGYSAAVSADGNTIVAGAYGDDDNGNASGSAYVYRWNGSSWAQQTKLTAFDGAAIDQFGFSVSVSADGNTVVIGAWGDDVGKGSAYVYRWNGTNWIQTKLAASDGAASDQFGLSVAASADGNTLAIGAHYDDVGANADQGSAYVYRWNGSSWAQQTKLTAFDGAAIDQFGFSVSVSADGNTIVVGAYTDDVGANANQGSAYIFNLE